MTRAVRDQMVKDANGSISDHLRNHIHLTNCIHLKNHNHMHKHSPILSNRGLLRDLVALQRSRSLRDPSATPPSRHSPSVVDIRLKRGRRDDLVSGRLSFSMEHLTEFGRVSEGSQHINRLPASKYAVGKTSRSGASPSYAKDGDDLVQNGIYGNAELRGKYAEIKKGRKHDSSLKTLSDQLKDIAAESDDVASSHNHGSGRQTQIKTHNQVAEANFCHGNGLSQSDRQRSKGSRRRRPCRAPQQEVAQNEMLVASDSYAQGRPSQKYHLEEGFQGLRDQKVNGVPQNGCGIPWNWSRIHDRGKSFLDMAGRSLSCGLSDPKFKKGCSTSRRMDIPDMPHTSELSSSNKSDGESLPLLLDASGSWGTIHHAPWVHDYSGELSIFSNSLLKQEADCDLASEGRSGELHTLWKHRDGRHKNLTQKYMPKTFRDLIGQNLVVQALVNAIARRKVGSLYLFYGPHGTGKTSCAHLFARALNCQSPEPPKPCGLCNSCIAQNTGKTRNVKEIGPIGDFDSESMLKILGNVVTSKPQSQYKVYIFDACDTMGSESWSAILQVIDRAPTRVVFILVCSSLEALPHLILSRCQKFFFPKIKDADIIYTLQWIATKEDLEIDKDALKLIASRSNGSLRDAEMTLEQLSLIGKRISLDLVQELAGLIDDEKLIDLLDLALSADTVNTVKNLRDIMASGIDPLALMSQLAAVITNILAGSHNLRKGRPRRKFFWREALSKEDMERLRQALKTLSEAEKQLRVSNDRITWLTAALLQLAPYQQSQFTNLSADTSFYQTPLALNHALIERPRKIHTEVSIFQPGSSGNIQYNAALKSTDIDRNANSGGGMVSQQVYLPSNDRGPINKAQILVRETDQIWCEVLEKIPNDSVKEFLSTEGKLISVNYGPAPTVQLLFNSDLTKSEAERSIPYISRALESVLQSTVAIEIRCNSRKDAVSRKLQLPATQDQSRFDDIMKVSDRDASSSARNRGEIVEIVENTDSDRQNIGNSVGVASATPNASTLTHERNQSLSLVRGRLSLAHVIQQQEGCSENAGWSKDKAVSIAEKLEQENLRLEPRSRNFLSRNPPKIRRKFPRLKIQTRKPRTLLKYVSCGRCYSTRSPSCLVTSGTTPHILMSGFGAFYKTHGSNGSQSEGKAKKNSCSWYVSYY